MSLEAAIAEWRSLLGTERVITEAAVQRTYGADCGGSVRRIPIALQPTSSEQVERVMRVAHRHRIAVYPISTGRNWGYGSALPAEDDCVLIDLSRLDRILHFDAQLGVVTLEPGVTQGMLSDFLEAGGHPYMVPTTGAGPNCSLVGNALERGFGVTPHADHFSAVTDIEAVLADGSVYRTALREVAGDELARLFKWGIGPYSAGLFSQGRLGIVTQMSIVLARRPACIKVALFSLQRDDLLEPAVEAVQAILATLPGLIGGINLMNQHRVLSMTAPYPKGRLGPDGLMPLELVTRLGHEFQILPWTGFASLYGTPGTVRAAQKVIRSALRGIASRLIFVAPSTARRIKQAAALIPGGLGQRLTRTAGTLERSLDIVSGRPSSVALPLAYWLSSNPGDGNPEYHPARDGKGLLWYAPLVPMRPHTLREYVSMVHDVTRPFGIEPLITATSLNDRLFESTVPILFEPGIPDRRESARQCLDALIDRGLKMGVFPYRIDIDTMGRLRDQASASSALSALLTIGMDSNHLMSPGRYF